MPRLPPLSAGSASQESSLRLPANKRIATPVSHRLNSITDPSNNSSDTASASEPAAAATTESDATGQTETQSSTPRRRSLASPRLPLPLPRRESGSSKISHPAPPYDWVPEPIEEVDGREPIEGEKLRRLRNEDDEGKTVLWWRRKRVVIIAAITVLLVALAIGLGVGLAPRGENDKHATGAGNRTLEPLKFPLGQWTVSATLAEVETGCTSDDSTWRCYPYWVGGETIFDFTIANTSASYAPNSTVGLPAAAANSPANLTISSSNPFAIPFTNQSLSYIRSPSNLTAERLEWTFEMIKAVLPSSAVMRDGGTAECLFPGTVFTGSLYLNAEREVLSGLTGAEEWPYAVEIRQSKQSTGKALECRGLEGGSVQVPAVGGKCDCMYRNY